MNFLCSLSFLRFVIKSCILFLMISPGITIYSLNSTNRINNMLTLSSLNVCMLGKKHKPIPSFEPRLKGMCEKWKANSCCYANVSAEYEDHGVSHGFSFNHCPTYNMSKACSKSFLDDLCFYECSPDVGPWIVKVDGMKIRKERIYKAPLCKNECHKWWEDCKNDYTCVPNWVVGFKWIKGRNECPSSSKCQTFSEIYGNAKNFCETIWDNSWRVAQDGELCFQFGANNSINFYQNSLVAKTEAHRIVRLIQENSGSENVQVSFMYFLSIFYVLVYII